MEQNTGKPGDYETIYAWDLMTGAQRHMVIAEHCIAFKAAGKKVKLDYMERIFELGKPKCVIGIVNGKPITRIEAESVEIMKLIMNEYL